MKWKAPFLFNVLIRLRTLNYDNLNLGKKFLKVKGAHTCGTPYENYIYKIHMVVRLSRYFSGVIFNVWNICIKTQIDTSLMRVFNMKFLKYIDRSLYGNLFKFCITSNMPLVNSGFCILISDTHKGFTCHQSKLQIIL